MNADDEAVQARREARNAKRCAWAWWAQIPVVCIGYWFISNEPPIEKMLLVYLAAVSIIAIAVTYEAKAKGAEAKAAGYENP